MIDNLKKVKKEQNVSVRRVGDTYYILREGKCFQLNETGVLIVKYIGSDFEIDEFSNRIVQKYGNSEGKERVKQDIIKFIDFLAVNQMVTFNE